MIVRPPAVAGTFYPSSPVALRDLVARCLDEAAAPPPDASVPRAVIVPHAGLVYSGAIAASAYRRLAPAADRIRRVVLAGPSHRVAFSGIAATTADRWDTPLGPVAVDRDAVDRAVAMAGVVAAEEPHAAEHCLEVQLPFLQTVVPDAAIVPFVVGDADADQVAAVLDLEWDRPDTVVVLSTDLSHYHRYEEARDLDARTAAAIVARRPELIAGADACGARPLRGLLVEAIRRDLAIEQLDLRNSGDTAGDHDRVVGYGAFAVG